MPAILRAVVLSVVLTAVGCTRQLQAGAPFSSVHQTALADSLATVLREYASSWDKASCDNPTPVLRFFDWSGSGLLEVSETAIKLFPDSTWPRYIKSLACARSEKITVDSLVVRVFSPDVASVAWTFVATYGENNGKTHSGRGTVLQVWHRTPGGWRAAVGMGAHQALPDSAMGQ
jgi:hypothetical protein